MYNISQLLFALNMKLQKFGIFICTTMLILVSFLSDLIKINKNIFLACMVLDNKIISVFKSIHYHVITSIFD